MGRQLLAERKFSFEKQILWQFGQKYRSKQAFCTHNASDNVKMA